MKADKFLKKVKNYIPLALTGIMLAFFICSNAIFINSNAETSEDIQTESQEEISDGTEAEAVENVQLTSEIVDTVTDTQTLTSTENVTDSTGETDGLGDDTLQETGDTNQVESIEETSEGLEGADGEETAEVTETTEESETGCICTSQCTVDSINTECPICSSNYENCAYTDTQTDQEEALECICIVPCNENNHSTTCPVCSEDYTKCTCTEELECSCISLCTEDSCDETCPVCSRDYSQCKYEECICTKKCMHGKVNLTCPVCSKNYLNCQGSEEDYVASITYSISGSQYTDKYVTLAEALEAVTTVTGSVHEDGNTSYVAEIKMLSNLTLSSSITAAEDYDFSIDFSGYTISFDEGAYFDFLSNDVVLKDSTASTIAFNSDNIRPGGIVGTSGKLINSSASVTFNSGYYRIANGAIVTGASTVSVTNSYMFSSVGNTVSNVTNLTINSGFYIYDDLCDSNYNTSVTYPERTLLAEQTLSLDGTSLTGYGISAALYSVIVEQFGENNDNNPVYYYSTFEEAFNRGCDLSKAADGSRTVISINSDSVTSVAISKCYSIYDNDGGYEPSIMFKNISFIRGGTTTYDGTLFAVYGGSLTFSDCKVNGYISDTDVSVSSMITAYDSGEIILIGNPGAGCQISGNVALYGATAGDPCAGIYLMNGAKCTMSGFIEINNNVCYKETTSVDGTVESTRIPCNMYMDTSANISVAGPMERTESFRIGISSSLPVVETGTVIGSLTANYLASLQANSVSLVDLSAFYMDNSAAYSLEYDFTTNTIYWVRNTAVLPEAGILRLEYIILIIGLVGCIIKNFAFIRERKALESYILGLSIFCLAIGSGIGIYHIKTERDLVATNNAIVKTLSTDNRELEEDEVLELGSDKSIDTVLIGGNEEEIVKTDSLVPQDGRVYIGIVEIEELNIKLPVLKDYSDADMKTTPCVYYGSRENNNLVIVGHNYDSQFGDINKLTANDTVHVNLTLLDGSTYHYQSIAYENLNPEQIDEMLMGDWDLTLFTCSYSGDKRIAIRCDLID